MPSECTMTTDPSMDIELSSEKFTMKNSQKLNKFWKTSLKKVQEIFNLKTNKDPRKKLKKFQKKKNTNLKKIKK